MRKEFQTAFVLIVSVLGLTAQTVYTNPVIKKNLPDPCVLQVGDTYYLYATESQKQMPIYSSKDLIHWQPEGYAFTEKGRPAHLDDGSLWAPDVKKIGNQYVMAYSESRWMENKENGIGIATAKKATGPFKDRGLLFTSREIGVGNSIDPFLFEEDGRWYLIWGSMGGIYLIELDKKTLKVKKGAEKVKLAGRSIEGAHIFKRDGKYYLFASAGSCCSGKESTYRVIVGRADNLEGPYLSYDGKPLDKENSTLVITANEKFAGPGHGSTIITDIKADTWYVYHSYVRDELKHGRTVMLDKIQWTKEGWPYVNSGTPAVKEEKGPQL